MINAPRFLMAISFACLLPFQGFAEAPVVDESENFALLDDQQAAYEQPVDKAQVTRQYNNDQQPLVANNPEADSSNAMLLNKLQGLQQELQELRGQLEVQAHDLKLLQQQQLSFYKDLDARLRSETPNRVKKNPTTPPLSMDSSTLHQTQALSSEKSAAALAKKTASEPIITPVVSNVNHSNPAEEQISYLAAYELVKNQKFAQALPAMQSFVEKYPQGGYTANAQYWLGELYMVKKDYAQAIKHFEVVLNKFSSSSKSSASMLKIGYALASSGKTEEAVRRLQEVVKNYPDTNTAALAKAKLETLNYH